MNSADGVFDALRQIVERVAGQSRTPVHVTAETRFTQDFWVDSAEMLEVLLACEQHFGIVFEESRDLTPETLATLGAFADLIRSKRVG